MQREQMVEDQIARRGIRDPDVLEAMRSVPRELFVPERQAEFVYEDSPLPIEEGQTISQPYIVALMTEALELSKQNRVLEVGTGSGYAAAVLAHIAAEVYTIERHPTLAESAKNRLAQAGYQNVSVRAGDGTLGWPEKAPFDAIVVAAGGPSVPPALLDQLAIGGRLVIPIGKELRLQRLIRVTRTSHENFTTDDLGGVQFVPLIGAAGFAGPPPRISVSGERTIAHLIAETAEPIDDIESTPLAPLLNRIGDASLVLIGEATHGTSEFYRMRARITRELILRHGFRAVAIEGDWPDAARIDRYVRNLPPSKQAWRAFNRFPTWMWRNAEVREFVEWLREYNLQLRDSEARVRFCGLDLYSLYTSAAAVIEYLERVDPPSAELARLRYGCLTPWQQAPEIYGRAALTGRYQQCEREIVAMLRDLLQKRIEYVARDGEHYFDALQNARVVTNAERYYRVMYYGSRESWNLRDQHMFDTLVSLRSFMGSGAKVVVWEHNSHVGDAAATEMGVRGEHNVGNLCRRQFGEDAYLIGCGTDHGEVAAANKWDDPMEVMRVRPAHAESYERICHDSGVPAFLLPLRYPVRDAVRQELMNPRLERAIGVIYSPSTELQSHYFQACLPRQFDEYIWFDETRAVHPLGVAEVAGMPETYPFGL